MQDALVHANIAKAKAGDIDAFGELVEEFQSTVRGFIAMVGAPRDAVEDLAQETFLAAFKALGTFDETCPFWPWLRAIARNLVRRHLTNESRENRLDHHEVRRILMDREPAPATDQHEEKFRLRFLLDCLKGLPEHSMDLVKHKYYTGKNSQEIAEILHLSPEAVRMSLVRIRTKLRGCVERHAVLEES
jgi:RNA polymerase sigma-70 factor, ECF subfamily